jgi:hypothetical protein
MRGMVLTIWTYGRRSQLRQQLPPFSIRWIVDYETEAGIALYQKLGLGLVLDEVAVV